MNKLLSEITYVRDAIPIDDLDTDLTSAEFYPMDNARKVMAVAHCAEHTAGEWFRARLWQDEDSTGASDPETLTDWVTVLAPFGNGPCVVVVEADVTEMEPGKPFVGVEIEAENQVAQGGGAILMFGDNRYNPSE